MENMKLYIDERVVIGQPVIDGVGLTNYKEQPFFALGGILIETEERENQLIDFVDRLKAKNKIQAPELKSKSIYERKPDFIIELFEELKRLDIPFFLEVMDKKYYLATQLINTLFLPSNRFLMDKESILIRNGLADLFYRNLPEKFYVEFCELCFHPSRERFENLLSALCEYFKPLPTEVDEINYTSVKLTWDDYLDDYDNGNYPNAYLNYLPPPDLDKKGKIVSILPNTHAFSYLVARCERLRVDEGLPPFTIIHDEQKHFDEIIKSTLDLMKSTKTDELLKDSPVGAKAIFKIPDTAVLTFEDSKGMKIIQVADIITGFIMRAWNDFHRKEFGSLDRYKSILRSFIFDNVTHKSHGINLLIPQTDYELLLEYLRNVQYRLW